MSDFSVADHLDRDTIVALAGYSTIGSPVTDAAAFFDQTERATTSLAVNEYLDRLGDVEAE